MGVLNMKRKTIYSVLVTAILLGAFAPLNIQAVDDALTWHPSLDDEKIVWRITNQYLYDPMDPHSLAGEDLFIGSTLAYEINDTIPGWFSEVYDSGPPSFLKLIVNYHEVSFYDIVDGEPNFLLQFLIIPYIFTPAATGIDENITQFLEHVASVHPNITGISYFFPSPDYVKVSIFNDFCPSFEVTYNNNTGICSEFFFEDAKGELFGQLDIWESDIDDYGVDTTNTLNFHPNLVDGTVLSWKYTEITYEPYVDHFMEVNNVTLAVNHIFSFEYSTIPTDPMVYYGGNYTDPSVSFFDVFFEGDPAEFDHLSRVQWVLWVTLTNPLSLTMYNGTVFTMEDIHTVRDFNDPGIQNTTISVVGDTLNLAFDFEEENDLWSLDMDINVNSGIVSAFAADIVGFVHFEMEYVESESSLLIDGTVNPDFEPEDGTRTLPGFNWFYLLFAIVAVLPIIRRRK